MKQVDFEQTHQLTQHTQTSLIERVDLLRVEATSRLNSTQQITMGQFLTPVPTACLLALMFDVSLSSIRLLDAGAGIGSLSAAFVWRVCQLEKKPKYLSITAYEIDSSLIKYLRDTIKMCESECKKAGIHFTANVLQEDFIEVGVNILECGLFSSPLQEFDCVILNPPYRKIQSKSEYRKILSRIKIETSNLYTAFIWLASRLLAPNGQLVAITPRSFCNGSYFRNFRKTFLETMHFQKIHIFESRNQAFKDNSVLQENIIFHVVKAKNDDAEVEIISSVGPEDKVPTVHRINHSQLVQPNDPNLYIRIVTNSLDQQIAKRMMTLTCSLEDLGLTVSTGKVVDFRTTKFLRDFPEKDTVPLLYPGHLVNRSIIWPKLNYKKPNAIVACPETENLLLPSGIYVLTKRFTAKEEHRRILAAVFDPNQYPQPKIGFENHLNYYHCNGAGLSKKLAWGLAAFLNSTLFDKYFRQFNGHTQVNSTDLRSLKYPNSAQLEVLGEKCASGLIGQDKIDSYIEELFSMPINSTEFDPIKTTKRIDEALAIIKDLGLPREQYNERSALVLLSFLDLRTADSWADAKAPMRGITPVMKFIAENYGRIYKPNTRETIRDETVAAFVNAGILGKNPDKPDRPPNSPKTVYQIESAILALLQTYETEQWNTNLRDYLVSIETLKARYAQHREMQMIPIKISNKLDIKITAGGQNILIKKVIDEFCPRFTPGGDILYLGDAGSKYGYCDTNALLSLGITLTQAQKIPDIIIHYTAKNWLVIVEAVSSNGPINVQRQNELKSLFGNSTAGLVFVTSFPDRSILLKFIHQIAWETEVWIASDPSHMIHFNGERFLGPY
ncbi:putative O-methyltransferase [Cylindrospermum stagnale PCC 7417]|uniref:site-specific DNA-methyltransferase (adenine-specific) n=1 Tax=Cylindrospermum stagnale PCC 7417 TaxID=56107 RepID=K9X2C4_9NOST|nr:BsuBI/PstI family type II restriction endonuclease [Cylindrospermum stagnale]AFZ26583.1 putative O-methyltransferase [Cylindrospermum stagnale PCC 7417]